MMELCAVWPTENWLGLDMNMLLSCFRKRSSVLPTCISWQNSDSIVAELKAFLRRTHTQCVDDDDNGGEEVEQRRESDEAPLD